MAGVSFVRLSPRAPNHLTVASPVTTRIQRPGRSGTGAITVPRLSASCEPTRKVKFPPPPSPGAQYPATVTVIWDAGTGRARSAAIVPTLVAARAGAGRPSSMPTRQRTAETAKACAERNIWVPLGTGAVRPPDAGAYDGSEGRRLGPRALTYPAERDAADPEAVRRGGKGGIGGGWTSFRRRRGAIASYFRVRLSLRTSDRTPLARETSTRVSGPR